MDIEIDADNFMNYMEDENRDGDAFKTENLLIQNMNEAKKDKDEKANSR